MADDVDTGQAPDPVEQVKNDALASMAKPENIENYVAERQARDAESRGDDVDDEGRAERIRKALSEAREATNSARQQNGLDQQQPDLEQQYQDAQTQWEQAEQQEQQYEAERDQARNEGRFMAVAEHLKQANPPVWNQITDTMRVVDVSLNEDQAEAFKRGITRGNASEGMAIAHRLSQPSYNPDGSINMSVEDKVSYLANLSPQELENTLDQARTFLQLEASISQQFAQRYANMPPRHSKAPAPFTRPRGWASPPKDVAALAARENPKDYIAMRQAQMKRGEG